MGFQPWDECAATRYSLNSVMPIIIDVQLLYYNAGFLHLRLP
jgi:hypothetical protein